MPKTDAQRRAERNFYDKNKEKRIYANNKSASKRFINEMGTKEDLEMLLELINNRMIGMAEE
jgi:hypothetical protein